MNAFYIDERRQYQIENIAYHCYHAGLTERLDSLISKRWMNVRIHDLEDYSGFLRDLELAWELTQNNSTLNIPSLLRYSMINSAVNTIAKGVPPILFPIFVDYQLWSFEGALTLADQFVDPWKRNEAFLAMCLQSNISETEIERTIIKALDIKSNKFEDIDAIKASFLEIVARNFRNNDRIVTFAINATQNIDDLYYRQATLASIAEFATARHTELLGESINLANRLIGVEKLHAKANLSFFWGRSEFTEIFDELVFFHHDNHKKENLRYSTLYDRLEISLLRKIIPHLPVELYPEAKELILHVVQEKEYQIDLLLLLADPYISYYSTRSQFGNSFEDVEVKKDLSSGEREKIIQQAIDIAPSSKDNDPLTYFSNIVKIAGLREDLQSMVIRELPNNIQVSGQLMNRRFLRNLNPKFFEDIVDLIIRYPKVLQPSLRILVSRLPSYLTIKLIQNINSFENKMESIGILIPYLPLHLQYSWACLAYDQAKLPENKVARDKAVYIYSNDNNDKDKEFIETDQGRKFTPTERRLYFNKAVNFLKYNKNNEAELYNLFTFERVFKVLTKTQINQLWKIYVKKFKLDASGNTKLTYITGISWMYLDEKNRKEASKIIFNSLAKLSLTADRTANENISLLCAFSDLLTHQDFTSNEEFESLLQINDNPKLVEALDTIKSAILLSKHHSSSQLDNEGKQRVEKLLFSSSLDDFSLAWIVISLLPHVGFSKTMMPYIEKAILNRSWGELKESFAAIRAFKSLPEDVCLELMPDLGNPYIKLPLRIICEQHLYTQLFSKEVFNRKSLQILYEYLSHLDYEVWFQNIITLAPFIKKYKGKAVADEIGRLVLDTHNWWQPRNMS